MSLTSATLTIKEDWLPAKPISRYFTPTNEDLYNECRKARVKNYNLPLLQYLYHGDELQPLSCLLSGLPGWIDFPCLVNSKPKQRFNIDFNHIRQRKNPNRVAGNSVDKGAKAPSSIFREIYLSKSPYDLAEFLCIMPISQEYHSYITQDSAIGDITLLNFPASSWPWFLKTQSNFDNIKQYGLSINYTSFIDHLSDISHDSIRMRMYNVPTLD